MGIFDMWPWTNFHEMNLNWILKEMKRLGLEWEELQNSLAPEITDAVNKWFDEHPEQADALRVANEALATTNALNERTEGLNPTIPTRYKEYNGTRVLILEYSPDDFNTTLQTSGDPWTGGEPAYTYAVNNSIPVVYTSSLSGYVVCEGTLYPERGSNGEAWFYLSLDNLSHLDANGATAESVSALGQNVIGIWSPVWLNGNAVDYTQYSSRNKYAEIVTRKHPRTIIARVTNGNYRVYFVGGRNVYEPGFDYDDIQSMLTIDGDIIKAYNMDGGGSSQLVIDNTLAFSPVTSPDPIGRSAGTHTCVTPKGVS